MTAHFLKSLAFYCMLLQFFTKALKTVNILEFIYFIYIQDNYRGIFTYKGEFIMAKVLISMPERFLNEIDGVADNENRSRSELIREALRTYIHRNRVRNTAYAQKNAELLEELLD